MTLLSQSGSFIVNTVLGNQEVSLDSNIWGGSSPKAIIIWGAWISGTGVTSQMIKCLGMATGSTNRATISVSSQDASDISSTYRLHDNTKAISVISSGVVIFAADLVSFGADKFTIDWTKAFGLVTSLNYLCIGGDDLENVYLDEIQSPSSIGNQAYTGIGFQPDALISFGAQSTSSPSSMVPNAAMFVGTSDGTDDYCSSMYAVNGKQISEAKRYAGANLIRNPYSGSEEAASVISFDSDGYTLNWSEAVADNYSSWVLCLKGPRAKVIVDAQKTSVGSKTTTIGFPGKAAFLTTFMGPGSSTIENNARIGIGTLDADGNQAFVGTIDDDNQEITSSARIQDQNEILKAIDSDENILSSATGSFSESNLVLDWTITDAIEREFGGIILGDKETPIAWGSVDGTNVVKNADEIHNLQNPGGEENIAWIRRTDYGSEVSQPIVESIDTRFRSVRSYSGDANG